MGRLLFLELENFKSYNGKHVVGPFDDFTCIVGPNGSGKSNMMDAISFVLGVQSKHLRSTHLKELIYRKDAASATSGAKRASVKLVYEVHDDEVEGLLGGKKLTFCRVVTASGASTYRLNDTEVSYEAYEQQLQAIGVLVKVRNFLVFQGDVESVASKSPLELTRLVEQISGSDALRLEYDELYRQKEEAEEKTIMSMQNKRFHGNERKAVKDQRDEAELFLQRRQTLEELKTEHVLWQLLRTKTTMEEAQSSIAAARERLGSVREREEEVEGQLGDAKKALAKASKVVAAAEGELATKEKAVADIVPKLLEVREKMRLGKKRSSEHDKTRGRMEKDLAAQREAVDGLQADIAALNAQAGRAEKEIASITASHVELTEAKVQEYHKLKSEASGLIAIDQTTLTTLDGEIASKKQRLDRLKQQESLLTLQQEADEALLATNVERGEKLAAAVADGTKRQEELNKARAALDKEITSGGKRLEQCTAEAEAAAVALRDAGDDRRRNRAELRMAEAVETLRRIYGGQVHGRLSDLVDPVHKAHSTAISVAMGKHLDAVVVETSSVAKECVRYLRDQRIGTATFIPLDNIPALGAAAAGGSSASAASSAGSGSTGEGADGSGATAGSTANSGINATINQVRQAVENANNSESSASSSAQQQPYHLCLDLIQCDDAVRAAVYYAVGTTVVCSNLRLAQRLCFERGVRVKAVTTSGHVISKSGAMTGGSIGGPGDSAGSSSGGRFAEKEVDKLRRRKADLEAEMAALRKSLPTRQMLVEADMRCKQAASEIHYSSADKKICDEKIAQLRQQLGLKKKTVGELQKERTSLLTAIQALETKQGELQQRISTVEGSVFAAFSASIGVSNICEFETTKLRRLGDLTKRRAELAERLTQLSAQLEYEQQKDFAQALQKLTDVTMKAHAEAMADLASQEASLLQKEEKLLTAKKAIEARLATVRGERDAAANELKDLQTARAAAVSEREALLREVSAGEIGLERVRSTLHDTLKKAQVEEIALPTTTVTSTGSGRRSKGKRAGDASSDDSAPSSLSSRSTKKGNAADDSDEDDADDADADLKWTGSVVSSSDNGGSSSDDTESDSAGASTRFSQTQNAAVVRDSRKAARVDLSPVRKQRKTAAQQAEREAVLSKQIVQIKAEIAAMQPNLHALERYEDVLEKLRCCNEELESAKATATTVAARFEAVKAQRRALFQDCYLHVSTSLSVIYKELTRSSRHPLGGNAYLTLDNNISSGPGSSSSGAGAGAGAGTGTSSAEEPYLGGIRYTAMPPMKRFRDMDQLSGGEKTVAALALLFAIHSYRQAPFFVLDEIDAALDNVNVQKVCAYIRQRSKDFQCIVISLKDLFFEHADSLVGICKDVDNTMSSRILTLKLSNYPAGGGGGSAEGTAYTGGEVGTNGYHRNSSLSTRATDRSMLHPGMARTTGSSSSTGMSMGIPHYAISPLSNYSTHSHDGGSAGSVSVGAGGEAVSPIGGGGRGGRAGRGLAGKDELAGIQEEDEQ